MYAVWESYTQENQTLRGYRLCDWKVVTTPGLNRDTVYACILILRIVCFTFSSVVKRCELLKAHYKFPIIIIIIIIFDSSAKCTRWDTVNAEIKDRERRNQRP